MPQLTHSQMNKHLTKEEDRENISLSETEGACWKTVRGGNVLIIRWDQILESFGNQNREFGHEILDNYIFSLK